MLNDPLHDIRSIRRKISEECSHLPEKVFDYYQQVQERLKASGKFTFVKQQLETANAVHVTKQNAEPDRELPR